MHASTQPRLDPPPDVVDPRADLLDAVVGELATHGVGDLSLRSLATAIGTSHRMLIYHFGSKDDLLVAVVEAVEARQRVVLAELAVELDGLDPEDRSRAAGARVSRRFWRRLADPDLWPFERLFFELYGLALGGHHPFVGFLDDIVESWLAPTTELGVRIGLTRRQARDEARLGLAVTRGLLLDLLATGDRRGVDRAMARFFDLWVAADGYPHGSGRATPGAGGSPAGG